MPEAAIPLSVAKATQHLLDTVASYLLPEDRQRVAEAAQFARVVHGEQKRQSGEPYILHPLAVAQILADMKMDTKAILAGLLHDVIEDVGPEQRAIIQEKFGEKVAMLVEALTKMDKLNVPKEQAQADNYRKMLLAMSDDLRVMVVKLADRLHNASTLAPLREDKRRRIAEETLQIYAPIAYRMGLNGMFHQLQEAAFPYAYPAQSQELAQKLQQLVTRRKPILERVRSELQNTLARHGLQAELQERQKTTYSINRKMQLKNLSFNEVKDIHAFRILVEKESDCYQVLWLVHKLYRPIPGRFKDYIAIPKDNGYQSLHTILTIPPLRQAKLHPQFQSAAEQTEIPIEIQIRTHEMHCIAEMGIASHWAYKNDGGGSDLRAHFDNWLKGLLDNLSSEEGAALTTNLCSDLRSGFESDVYVYTPKGDIRAMRRGSTVLDFAYHLHERIGNRCEGARVDGEMVALNTELKTGDRVEILTGKDASPKPEWLDFVKSQRSRTFIRRYLSNQMEEEVLALGKKMVEGVLNSWQIDLNQIGEAQWQALLDLLKLKTLDELWHEVGKGKRSYQVVATQLVRHVDQDKTLLDKPISISGTEGLAIRDCPACGPIIPGDPIIGEFSKDQGLLIHRHDCRDLRGARGRTTVNLKWSETARGSYDVMLQVFTDHRPGMLAKVAGAIAQLGINIANLNMDEEGRLARMTFTLTLIGGARQLAEVKGAISPLEGVVSVKRISTRDANRINAINANKAARQAAEFPDET